MNTFTAQQQHTVDLLANFSGDQAGALYEFNHRSLHELASQARDSVLPQSAAFLAGLELARELLGEQLRSREIMDSPAAITNYLTLHFAGQQYESFVVLYLDAQNRLIASEELFRGTLTQASVYPREIEAGAASQCRRHRVRASASIRDMRAIARRRAADQHLEAGAQPGGRADARSLRGRRQRGGVVRAARLVVGEARGVS